MSGKPGIHEVKLNLNDEEYRQLKIVCEHYRSSSEHTSGHTFCRL